MKTRWKCTLERASIANNKNDSPKDLTGGYSYTIINWLYLSGSILRTRAKVHCYNFSKKVCQRRRKFQQKLAIIKQKCSLIKGHL